MIKRLLVIILTIIVCMALVCGCAQATESENAPSQAGCDLRLTNALLGFLVGGVVSLVWRRS